MSDKVFYCDVCSAAFGTNHAHIPHAPKVDAEGDGDALLHALKLATLLTAERDKYKAALEKISLASEAFNDWFEEARYYRKVAREALADCGEK